MLDFLKKYLNASKLVFWWQQFYFWLLPFSCVLCNDKATRTQLCQACYADLPWLVSACAVCANPLGLMPSSSLHACGECLKKPPPYDNTISLFHYQSPIDYLVLSLKFSQKLAYAKLLGELMAEKIVIYYQNRPKPDVIIPIPLHINRLQERGFNQALELARPISRKLKVPINYKDCTRIVSTLPQSSISANNRVKNIKNAFSLDKNFKAVKVALVDDVVTTGSTVSEIARMFFNSGIKVDVWCCARTSKELQ